LGKGVAVAIHLVDQAGVCNRALRGHENAEAILLRRELHQDNAMIESISPAIRTSQVASK
jgi:hypothetical protein